MKKIIVFHPYITYPGGASKYMFEACERLTKKGSYFFFKKTLSNLKFLGMLVIFLGVLIIARG